MKRLKLVSAVLLVSGLVAYGCGGSSTSPSEACNQVQETTCAKLYSCFTAAQLQQAGYPATEAACVTMSEQDQGCAAETEANACSGAGANAVYHGENVQGCIDQLNNLTCTDLMGSNVDAKAPKCDEICIVPT
ncbi:MAG: hypothetical protein QM831_23515 [Kofleriaceae bacterium]